MLMRVTDKLYRHIMRDISKTMNLVDNKTEKTSIRRSASLNC